MLLWYPKLSHFLKNYSSPCSQLFLLFLSLSSSVVFVSWWPLINTAEYCQSVSPWELLSLCRCRKTREIVKSRTPNSLRNRQLLSIRVSKASVPGLYWWLMPGGEAAATDEESPASLASLSTPLSRGQVLFLTLTSPRPQEPTHTSGCIRARSGLLLKWWFLFQYDSFLSRIKIQWFHLG